jgi:hypothetical protein
LKPGRGGGVWYGRETLGGSGSFEYEIVRIRGSKGGNLVCFKLFFALITGDLRLRVF